MSCSNTKSSPGTRQTLTIPLDASKIVSRSNRSHCEITITGSVARSHGLLILRNREPPSPYRPLPHPSHQLRNLHLRKHRPLKNRISLRPEICSQRSCQGSARENHRSRKDGMSEQRQGHLPLGTLSLSLSQGIGTERTMAAEKKFTY